MEPNVRLRTLIRIIIIIRYITSCAGQANLKGDQIHPEITGVSEKVKGVAEELFFKYNLKSKDAFMEMLNTYEIKNSLKKLLGPQKKVVDIDGDIILGGLVSIHNVDDDMCGPLMSNGSSMLELEAILYTIDKVNFEKDFLPDIELDAYILDDCYQESYTSSQVFDGPDFCSADGHSFFRSPNVAGVIRSEISGCDVAELLDTFKIPQVLYTDGSLDFIKKPEFEYLLTTVPSSKKAIERIYYMILLSRSTVFPDNKNDFQLLMGLQNSFLRINISIFLKQTYGNDSSTACNGYYDKVAEMLMKVSLPKAALIIGSQVEIDGVMEAVRSIKSKNSFEIIDSLSTAFYDKLKYFLNYLAPPVPGFEDYFKSLNVKTNKRNPWFTEYWELTFFYKLPETKQTPRNRFAKECNGNEELSTVEGLEIEETIKHTIDSVLAFAYAIKAMHADLSDGVPGVCDKMKHLDGTMMLKYLKNVSFKGLGGDYFEFKKKSDEPSRFKILLINQKDPKNCEYVSGGYYKNVTFDSLFENFHFEEYEILLSVKFSKPYTLVGELRLLVIVVLVMTGLELYDGISKKSGGYAGGVILRTSFSSGSKYWEDDYSEI
ncbi:metabotropic glutamate receptor 4 [Trichonephila inaurata madagascariensis]|uniref:Metabotropic glutamate receptor 4 n=1 Tax=Trichonephila inaurata madagascariensis TaxID=2747483 RepID=A0A8X6XIV9_9ARAC|nr:metabotropic glutamate receptor 4 [Trichonephila inaurata madagascariensis]